MNVKRQNKIGILGGTFDPVHYGHLLIAQSAAEEFGLDKVLLLPTGKSPHKSSGDVTEARVRYDMVSIATRDNPLFGISDIESGNTETSYTYLTLQKLQKKYPDAELYFIMGEDSLDEFHNWKRPEEICQKAVILVAARNDIAHEVESKIERAKQRYNANIHMLPAPYFSVSSREVRERIRTGKSVRYMIPESVENYIRQRFLYMQ